MFSVRPATPDDAAAVAAVLQIVVSERTHSAIDRAWSADEERAYLTALSSREVVHVVTDGTLGIVGLQVLDRWSTLDSMAHIESSSSGCARPTRRHKPSTARTEFWHW